MKKILLIVLFSTSLLYAIDVNVTFGYQYKLTNYHIHSPMYITLNIWQNINNLTIYGEYTNEFFHRNKLRFVPTQDFYTVGMKYKFTYMELKLEHQCYHPVTTWGITNGINGGYTKFEVKLCLP